MTVDAKAAARDRAIAEDPHYRLMAALTVAVEAHADALHDKARETLQQAAADDATGPLLRELLTAVGRCPVLECEALTALQREMLERVQPQIYRDIMERRVSQATRSEVSRALTAVRDAIDSADDGARAKATEVGTLLERVRRKILMEHRVQLDLSEQAHGADTAHLHRFHAQGHMDALVILDAAIAEANAAGGVPAQEQCFVCGGDGV